jgi:hypothetical protein
MKKFAVMCAAAFAVAEVFAIGATQEWVKRQLAAFARPSGSTNHAITASVPVSWFDDEQGGTASATIDAGIGAHHALKVVASTVPEVPVGTFYAVDGEGLYQNAKNGLLPTIYAAPYTTSRAATNALGVASVKSVRMGNFWAVDTSGKAWRMGIDGDTLLYCSDDRAKYVALRSTQLPERAAAYLLPSKTARLSVRAMLELAFPSLNAREHSETVYTVNAETTIAIGTITFTRTNKFGKTTVITFTPKDLQGVYKGPNGPFATKEEAQNALKDISNWDFGDWDTIWNAEGMGRMTREEFESSDVWRQFLSAFDTDKVETKVETPDMPAHPCPAPDDYWEFDTAVWEDMTIPDNEVLSLVWKVNRKYRSGSSAYKADPEKLEKWRGENLCKCGVVGCPNFGESQHRKGRVRKVDGALKTTDDIDGGDGCACCIRCVVHGSDPFVTIDEMNDHRANGVDAGFCGCACDMYNAENESEWPRDFHNRPSRVGGKDFACLCYCGKAKAANGEYVQHIKYRGDSPWCEKICSACEMVEDEEKYIPHNYPAFDTRHVTLRAPEWNDHTARKETTDPVGMPNDPTYYDRCGCACGAYDESKSSGLPAEFAAFHQQKMGSCRCHCGQTHTKNKRGDETVEPFPCPEICAVCFKVEDKESDAVFTFGGEQYKKLVLIDPTEEKHHAAHEVLCGCKCYNEVTTRHEWSIGGTPKETVTADGTMPDWHVVNAAGCGCECGGVQLKTLSPKYHHGPNKTLGACWCDCGGYHIGYHQPTKCRVCANCGKTEGGDLPDDESLHTLKSGAENDQGLNICRCDCGYFSSDGVFTSPEGGSNTVWEATGRAPSASGKLHDFDRSDASKNEIGSMPCLCWCGGKHEARMATTYQKNAYGDKICESICTYCKERTKDGKAATELDHDPIPASKKHCGCKCGYYGISDDHEAVGRAAQSAHLHIQSKGNAEGVAYCQCFGEGTGGKHHWHYPNAADTCPKICKYRRSGKDPLGHLATESGHESNITVATPADHEPKEYGCGCKCGLCGKGSAPLWKDDKTLHNHAQNATDQCHCDCEAKHLIGSGEGGHEWPPLAAMNACTCTCGEKHRDDWVNACGYCSVCGNIWRDGRRLDASVKQNHLWTYGGCYCDGGCTVGGAKILHPDGHRYMKNKCVCLCGETTREHILVEQKERVGQWTCWKCNAVFLNFRVTTVCSRCETTVSTEHIGSVGEHNPGCGEPKPSCWKCGCSCSTWGTHTTCNAHYCNACCTKKPPKPPRPPKPNPDDPNPDDPEPEPPEPYITCKHPRTETHDWDYHWTCEECSSDFHNWGWRKHCVDCGAYIDSESHNEGKHGPPCNGEDPGHVCEPSLCGEALNDGGTCQESILQEHAS